MKNHTNKCKKIDFWAIERRKRFYQDLTIIRTYNSVSESQDYNLLTFIMPHVMERIKIWHTIVYISKMSSEMKEYKKWLKGFGKMLIANKNTNLYDALHKNWTQVQEEVKKYNDKNHFYSNT